MGKRAGCRFYARRHAPVENGLRCLSAGAFQGLSTRPKTRAGRIARGDTLEISDAVMASLSHQGEDGALRIRAAGDPTAALHFDRTVEDLPSAGRYAPDRDVDISDVEVVKPKRDWLQRRLGEHAADRLPSSGEQLICAHRAGVGMCLPPAEELVVEGERLLPVGGEQLVPADPAECFKFGGLFLVAFEPLEQRNRRHLRIDGDRKATDVWDIGRRDMHGAAKLLDAFGSRIHVVDGDISKPARPEPHFPRVLRQGHQPADRSASRGKQAVGPAGHRCVVGAPAHDVGIEGLGSLHVGRRQLVPNETSMRTGHASLSPIAEDSRPSALCDKVYFIMAAATSSSRRGNWMRRGAFCRVADSSPEAAFSVCEGRVRYPISRIDLARCLRPAYEYCDGPLRRTSARRYGGLDYAAQEASFEAKGSQGGRAGCRSRRRVFVAGGRCVRGDRGADRGYAIP